MIALDYVRPSRLVDVSKLRTLRTTGDVRLTDATIVALILGYEGVTFTNAAADRGGPTKFGITQAAWSAWIGHPATIAEMKAITQPQAEAFYRTTHVRPFDIVPDPLRVQVIDYGVHRGVQASVKELQKVVGAHVDGWIGTETTQAVSLIGGAVVANNLLVGSRVAFYENLIARDPSQVKWRNGWRKRAMNFYAA